MKRKVFKKIAAHLCWIIIKSIYRLITICWRSISDILPYESTRSLAMINLDLALIESIHLYINNNPLKKRYPHTLKTRYIKGVYILVENNTLPGRSIISDFNLNLEVLLVSKSLLAIQYFPFVFQWSYLSFYLLFHDTSEAHFVWLPTEQHSRRHKW